MAGIGLVGFSSFAFACCDFVDFAAGDNYKIINDTDSVATRSWNFDIHNNLSGYTVNDVTFTSATLTIKYGATDSGAETWTLNFGMGNLPVVGSTPQSKDFSFSSSALADLQTDGLIKFTVTETTSGYDSYKIWESSMCANFTVNPPKKTPGVPEPATTTLLGLGLASIGYFTRRKKLLI